MRIAAGWYPDPTQRHADRYFDGVEWTEQVADSGVAAVDPLAGSDGSKSPLRRLVDGAAPESLVQQLTALREANAASPSQFKDTGMQAFCALVERLIADDILSDGDEDLLFRASAAIFDNHNALSWLREFDEPLWERKMVAWANNGRLYVWHPQTVRVMVAPDELVYSQFDAAFAKEVPIREWRGGSLGLSIPLGETGVRLRVGGLRGRSVQVGEQLEPQDVGTLAVTADRIIFVGPRKTVDIALSRVVGLTLYEDGLVFNVSGRENSVMFVMPEGAAFVAATVQALLATPAAGHDHTWTYSGMLALGHIYSETESRAAYGAPLPGTDDGGLVWNPQEVEFDDAVLELSPPQFADVTRYFLDYCGKCMHLQMRVVSVYEDFQLPDKGALRVTITPAQAERLSEADWSSGLDCVLLVAGMDVSVIPPGTVLDVNATLMGRAAPAAGIKDSRSLGFLLVVDEALIDKALRAT